MDGVSEKLEPEIVTSNYPRNLQPQVLTKEYGLELVALYSHCPRLVFGSLWSILMAGLCTLITPSGVGFLLATLVFLIRGYWHSHTAIISVMRAATLGSWSPTRRILSVLPFLFGPVGLVMILPIVFIQQRLILDFQLFSTSITWEGVSHERRLQEIALWEAKSGRQAN